MNLKHERIKVWEEKSGVTQLVSFPGYLGLPKKKISWAGTAGSLSSCVARNMFIREAVVLGMDASWAVITLM